MKFMSGVAEKIYDCLEAHGHGEFFVRKEAAGRLYINDDVKGIIRKKGVRLIEGIILILLATGIVCAVVLMTDRKVIDENNTIKRSGPGEGDKTYSLEVSTTEKREKVNVLVTEQKVTGERIDAVFEKAEKSLYTAILGENPSLDNVSASLDFVKTVEGTKVSVTWEADEEGFFSKTGRIRITPKEAERVTVYATLQYFEHSRRIPVQITIVPPGAKEADEQEERTRVLENAIRMADGEAPDSDRMTLPDKAGGETLIWQEPTDSRLLGIAFLGLLLAIMLIPRARSSLRDEEKKRKEQMERDYPEIISKLILLLTAGMTCSGAWKRICSDYLTAKPRLGKRFAYEEMVFSLRELELGKSEAAVYESFGNRTGIVCYKRLSSMLSRNLRRGSREILIMLDLESRDAYAARFDAVRKKGEETSTKLLLPMMGMLVIVIAIIVVPAFMGMGV